LIELRAMRTARGMRSQFPRMEVMCKPAISIAARLGVLLRRAADASPERRVANNVGRKFDVRNEVRERESPAGPEHLPRPRGRAPCQGTD
jgi:hypothetical protein